MFVYFMDIWSILQPFGILYGHLTYFVVIWYIYLRFGMLYQEDLATLCATEEAFWPLYMLGKWSA
jgi:hypothetical protein